ncbi:MAG: glycosyltransferase family 4 protein [Candidatus Hydrogenedentes bacterium]|nr:glycosyltransferase family 4 protein [Candidatus Hydrogenedentota bacterium]
MNICMTHYAFYPTTGGVESHLLDLSAELVRQGHEVHALVGSMAGQPSYSENEGIHIHRNDLMNPEWIRDQKAARGLPADKEDKGLLRAIKLMYADFIEEHGIDVVHGHNFHHFVPEHALALTELWRLGVPNLLTVHEVWSEFICHDLLKRAKWDYIINFCKHVMEGIHDQAPQLRNLELVYPGIDTDLFSPANRNRKWADKLGLEGRPVIIHPARMLPWKGVVYSVYATEILRKEFPNILLIITDTEDIVDWVRELKGYKEEILKLIRDRGLEPNVITQPFPYVELPWVYNFCDVVVYPTIEEEPFGLVPVEGMACSKPVVVTRSGGMVESVVDGETGFIIEKRNPELLAEKIRALLKVAVLAREFGRNGREHVKKSFSRERMARETVALYQRALARGWTRTWRPAVAQNF